MGKKKNSLTLAQRLTLIRKAQIGVTKIIGDEEIAKLPNLNERIAAMLQIENDHKKNKNKMLFFVMYDIENNKVRREIAKFLKRQGCKRVQKSIFFASSAHETFTNIYETLKAVQEMYDNNDSIFVVPISTDEVRAMKVIGKNIDFDIITGNRNTLFF